LIEKWLAALPDQDLFLDSPPFRNNSGGGSEDIWEAKAMRAEQEASDLVLLLQESQETVQRLVGTRWRSISLEARLILAKTEAVWELARQRIGHMARYDAMKVKLKAKLLASQKRNLSMRGERNEPS